MKSFLLLILSLVTVVACLPKALDNKTGSSYLKTITIKKPTADKLRLAFGTNCSEFIDEDTFKKRLLEADSALLLELSTDLCPTLEQLINTYTIRVVDTTTNTTIVNKTARLDGGSLSESLRSTASYQLTMALGSSKIPGQTIFQTTREIAQKSLQEADGTLSLALKFSISDFARKELGFTNQKIENQELDSSPKEGIGPKDEPQIEANTKFVSGLNEFRARCAGCHVAEQNGANKNHIEGFTEVPDRMVDLAGLNHQQDKSTIDAINVFLGNRSEGEF